MVKGLTAAQFNEKYDRDTLSEKLQNYVLEVNFPSIESFCHNAVISRKHYYVLVKEHELFCFFHEQLLLKREDYIVCNAIHNRINPIFSMFLLKQSCFGYKDKPDEKLDDDENKNTTGVVELPAVSNA